MNEQPYSEDDAEWDAFVASHPRGTILQTTNWARLKNRFGWSSQRIWMRQGGRLVGGAQLLIRSVAFGIVKIGYIPHGPILDWQDDEQVDVLLNYVDQAAYNRGAGLAKLEPYVWQDDLPDGRWESICQIHNLVTDTDTIQPPQTVLINVRASEEEILAAMKQKTRYNIRLSKKKGVVVRHGTEADLPAFNRMMMITAQRDSFAVHDPDYYRAAYEIFAPDDQCVLLMAEYQGQPLAGAMIFAAGRNAAYLYGASSNEERQRMPAYAIQWAAIRWAKARGCHSYDMWGIPDFPEEELEAQFTERTDGLWPVYRFKRGFGGEIIRTVGAADRVYNSRLHRLYQWRRNR